MMFKNNFLLVWLTVLGVIYSCEGTTPIAHKFVNDYKKIWDDNGSGADEDVSIYRPVQYQSGYFILGDVVVLGHSKPGTITMAVRALTAGALAQPASATEIWRDSGSGADDDVKILRLNPSSGYTCLGHIAIASYSASPDLSKYRCIKSNYVVNDGAYGRIWYDTGSGARKDVALFSNTEVGSVKGVYSNTFTSIAAHRTPGGKPSLLNSDSTTLESLLQPVENANLAIKVYESTESDLIWKDRGSGANRDISTHRPKGPGGQSVGDIAVEHYGSPATAPTVKAVKSDALSHPNSFRKIWDDSGSGARWDGSFWEPICPGNYVPLGYVSVRSHSHPSITDVMCVKRDYVVVGSWQWVWNDRGSGADDDVTVYQAVAKDGNGQGMQAMGAVRCHCNMDRTAYVLKASVIQYIQGKPATKYILQNVQYLFDDKNTLGNNPEQLARTIVENNGEDQQSVVREIGYNYEETHDWSSTTGLEVGIEVTVTAGIPDIAEASTTVSTTFSAEHTTGESYATSHSDTIQATIVVPANSQVTATVVSSRYVADVPYTAQLITIYADGTRSVRNNYSGVYRGAQISEIRIVYDKAVPLKITM